jgi:hypothetical protein
MLRRVRRRATMGDHARAVRMSRAAGVIGLRFTWVWSFFS